jgi:hypothetical protein
LDKAKPHTGNTRGLNLAVVRRMSIQMNNLYHLKMVLVSKHVSAVSTEEEVKGVIVVLTVS